MFVAARFFLGRSWTPGFGIEALFRLMHQPVNARAFETDLPSSLDTLLHTFNVSQRRWHLVRKYQHNLLVFLVC